MVDVSFDESSIAVVTVDFAILGWIKVSTVVKENCGMKTNFVAELESIQR